MRKLIIIPGATKVLGGTLVTLSLLIKGFEQLGASEHLCVLTWKGSFMEKYLSENKQEFCLCLIEADSETQFLHRAIQWADRQPKDWPLLLDNCAAKELFPVLLLNAVKLRFSPRSIYFFFHDLALSYNPLGYLTRKLIFTAMSPAVLCNSQFTASHICRFVKDIRGILYQPVDPEKFNSLPSPKPPPKALEPILAAGKPVMLTPSRLTKPGIINDKNLRALIPVLAQLKAKGYSYYGVVIGDDRSPGQIHTHELLEMAKQAGVDEQFTILPPTLEIENYYKYADVVVTLAPREPFGRTVVEAIACGVPVIGSNTGGIGEILNHFAPQWTVDPNDPVAAAEAIISTVDDPHTSAIINVGQRWIETECSLTGYAQKIMKITATFPQYKYDDN